MEASQSPYEHLKKVLDSTVGICFLGTPHHGSGLANWAAALAVALNVLKEMNAEILAVLKRDSEVLERIQGSFHGMLASRGKQGLRSIEITCFYEEMPITGIGQVCNVSLPWRAEFLLTVLGCSTTFRNYTRIRFHWNPRESYGND